MPRRRLGRIAQTLPTPFTVKDFRAALEEHGHRVDDKAATGLIHAIPNLKKAGKDGEGSRAITTYVLSHRSK